MTTATQQKPAAQAPAKVIFQGTVSIDKIDVVSNIRKTFNEQKMKELIESVRHRGINQPVLLRPGEKSGRYILVAGHRRLKAAKEIGLKDVPVIVKDLTAEEAGIDQAQENLQREDLSPIEEAQGFKLLTQPSKDSKSPAKYTPEQLAKLVDKSPAYVYRSIRLLELPKDAIVMIESGEWTPAHGHQALRIAPEQREALIKEWLEDQYDGDTAKAFSEWIDHQIGKTLSNAEFPKDKPYAGKPACSSCPLNTGNQGMLFDGAIKGKCTGPDCFEAKEAFYTKEQLEKAKAAAQKLGFQWLGEGEAKGYGSERTFKGSAILSPEEAKKAKDPKKYAAGWVTYKYRYSSDDKDGMVIVRLLTEAEKQAEAKRRAASSPKPTNPKDEFIAAEVDKEFGREIARIAHKKPLEAARSIASHELDNSYSMDDSALEILGFKSKTEIEKKVKVSKSVEELLAIALVVRAADNGEYEFAAEDVGADMKATRKTATAAAEKAWTAKQLVDAKKKA